jgi:hypothetical protein
MDCFIEFTLLKSNNVIVAGGDTDHGVLVCVFEKVASGHTGHDGWPWLVSPPASDNFKMCFCLLPTIKTGYLYYG